MITSRTSSGASTVLDRQGQRLCFLSLSTLAAGVFGREACARAARRLTSLKLGCVLGIEPLERAALGWEGLQARIRELGELAPATGFLVGVSCEQIGRAASVTEQIEAVVEQAAVVEAAGGVPVLLPLAALSRRRASEEEYVEVYRALLEGIAGPVIVDWTGPVLRPELLDYFPGRSFERVLALDPTKVRGVRLALLDFAREVRVRRRLLQDGQLLFSADRAHLAHLLLGANPGFEPQHLAPEVRGADLAGRVVPCGDFSHAILSASDARAEALARALERLSQDDVAGYLECMSDFA